MRVTPATASPSREDIPSDLVQAGRLLCNSENSFCVNLSPKSLPEFSLVLQPPDTGSKGALDLALPSEDWAGKKTEAAGSSQRPSENKIALPREMPGVEARELRKVSVETQTDRSEALKSVSFTAEGKNSMLRSQLDAVNFPTDSPQAELQCRTCNSALESVTNTNSASAVQEQKPSSSFFPGTNTTQSLADNSIMKFAENMKVSSSALPSRDPKEVCCSGGTLAEISEFSSPAHTGKAPRKVCCCGNTLPRT